MPRKTKAHWAKKKAEAVGLPKAQWFALNQGPATVDPTIRELLKQLHETVTQIERKIGLA